MTGLESNASRKGLEHGQCTRLCCLLQAEALARRKPRHTWHCMPARLSGASVAATRHNDTTIQHQPAMMPTLVNPASSRASRIAPRNSGQSRCRLGIMKRWQDDVFFHFSAWPIRPSIMSLGPCMQLPMPACRGVLSHHRRRRSLAGTHVVSTRFGLRPRPMQANRLKVMCAWVLIGGSGP